MPQLILLLIIIKLNIKGCTKMNYLLSLLNNNFLY